MSALPVLTRCLGRGLGAASWLVLGGGAVLLFALGGGFGARGVEERFGLLVQPLSWLPLLAVLCAAAQPLLAWPAHSPGQLGYRSLWLMGAPIGRCRIAAWLGSLLAGTLLLLAAGTLVFFGMLGQSHPEFARALRARFAAAEGSTPWIARAGEFQELRVPELGELRGLRLEPLYVFPSRELAYSWVPVRVRALAVPLEGDDRDFAPLGRILLEEPNAKPYLALPPELPTPCAIRLVREPGPASFAVSFAFGVATVEHEPLPTWRATAELALQHVPWLALVISVVLLVGRFAPPAVSSFAWLLLLPALASLPGLEPPSTLRSLLLGQVPSWTQLGPGPWLGAGLLLLASLAPARPRSAGGGRLGP